MSKQTFKKNSSFLIFLTGTSRGLQALRSFHTLIKNGYKTTWLFGTYKQRIKADSHAKFCMNSSISKSIINNIGLKVLSCLQGKPLAWNADHRSNAFW